MTASPILYLRTISLQLSDSVSGRIAPLAHGTGRTLHHGSVISSYTRFLQPIDFTPKVLADHVYYGFEPQYGYMEGN